MAVSFLQKQQEAIKTTPKQDHLQEQTVATNQITETVDKIVEMIDALSQAKGTMKDFEGLKKVLASFAAEGPFPDKEQVVLEGTKGQVVFSAKSNTTVIVDKQGLIGAIKAKVGYKGLLAMLNISLTDAKKYLSEQELAQFTRVESGSRTFASVTAKEAA